jgi:hypothetical protein
MIVPAMNGLRARTQSRRQSQGAGGHRPGSLGRRTGTSNGRPTVPGMVSLNSVGDREGDGRSDRSCDPQRHVRPEMVAAIDRGRFRAGGRCQPPSDARSLATGRTRTPREIPERQPSRYADGTPLRRNSLRNRAARPRRRQAPRRSAAPSWSTSGSSQRGAGWSHPVSSGSAVRAATGRTRWTLRSRSGARWCRLRSVLREKSAASICAMT